MPNLLTQAGAAEKAEGGAMLHQRRTVHSRAMPSDLIGAEEAGLMMCANRKLT